MKTTGYIWKVLPAVLVVAVFTLFSVGCANQKSDAKSDHPTVSEPPAKAELPAKSEHPAKTEHPK